MIFDIDPATLGFQYDKQYKHWVLNYGSDTHTMILSPTISDGYALYRFSGDPKTYAIYDNGEGDNISIKVMLKRIFKYGREDGVEALKTKFLKIATHV